MTCVAGITRLLPRGHRGSAFDGAKVESFFDLCKIFNAFLLDLCVFGDLGMDLTGYKWVLTVFRIVF